MTDAKDPLCGMTVRKEDSITSSYKRDYYYFCSVQCKEDFEKDPQAVLAMKAAREQEIDKERSATLENMIDEAAHEIRNPLTAIGGFARKIYKNLPENDSNRKYMEMIIENVDQLENMVSQLIELNTMHILFSELSDINGIIRDAVKSLEKELEENKIEVELNLMDDPPVIHLDSSKITTAVSNLIKNAVEAIGKPPKKLKISTFTRDGNIEIVVSNTGKGIPGDKIKYIFDPLFTSKIYGPGLGLTFVKKIVQEHRGDISVESKPKKGATFTIRLPLKSS